MRSRLAAGLVLLAVALAGCSEGPPGGTSTTPPDASPAQQDLRGSRAPNTPFDVTSQKFGIHSYTTKPQVPAGTIRMACGPTWGAVAPARGQFDWTAMDATLARAESWGFTDILFSICGTPEWAGRATPGPDEAVFGRGAAQPPKDLADWKHYVSAMAKRYQGRIAGYEVWNEPTSPQFFTGTPAEMGRMTQVAREAITEADPNAYVLSGAIQTHRPDFLADFGIPYLEELAKLDWPVDGIAAHFYVPAEGTPADRLRQIRAMQKELQRLGAPDDLPLWDTEVNYDVSAPGGEPDGRITGDRAAAWTARTYLDSWRTGIRRTYWYLWSQEYYEFPGIQMRIGDPSTAALTTLSEWVNGTRFEGCQESGGAVSCRFTRSGTPLRIAWAERRAATLAVAGTHEVCPITGSPCQARTGSVPLTEVPVRID